MQVADEVPENPRRVGPREFLQLDYLVPVAVGEEAGRLVEQFVAGGAEDEQGNAGRSVGDMLDKVEEDPLGPVNVVEDQDERPAAGDRLKDSPHAPEQFVLAVSARAKTHEGPNPQRGVLAFRAGERPQLGPRRLVRVIGEDSCSLAEELRRSARM